MAALHLELTFRSPLKESQTDGVGRTGVIKKHEFLDALLIPVEAASFPLLGFPPDPSCFCLKVVVFSACVLASGLRMSWKKKMSIANWRVQWRLKTGCVFLASVLICKIKTCENMMESSDCFLLCFLYRHSEDAGRNKVNEAKSVANMSCVGLNHVVRLTDCKELVSERSFRSEQNTH